MHDWAQGAPWYEKLTLHAGLADGGGKAADRTEAQHAAQKQKK